MKRFFSRCFQWLHSQSLRVRLWFIRNPRSTFERGLFYFKYRQMEKAKQCFEHTQSLMERSAKKEEDLQSLVSGGFYYLGHYFESKGEETANAALKKKAAHCYLRVKEAVTFPVRSKVFELIHSIGFELKDTPLAIQLARQAQQAGDTDASVLLSVLNAQVTTSSVKMKEIQTIRKTNVPSSSLLTMTFSSAAYIAFEKKWIIQLKKMGGKPMFNNFNEAQKYLSELQNDETRRKFLDPLVDSQRLESLLKNPLSLLEIETEIKRALPKSGKREESIGNDEVKVETHNDGQDYRNAVLRVIAVFIKHFSSSEPVFSKDHYQFQKTILLLLLQAYSLAEVTKSNGGLELWLLWLDHIEKEFKPFFSKYDTPLTKLSEVLDKVKSGKLKADLNVNQHILGELAFLRKTVQTLEESEGDARKGREKLLDENRKLREENDDLKARIKALEEQAKAQAARMKMLEEQVDRLMKLVPNQAPAATFVVQDGNASLSQQTEVRTSGAQRLLSWFGIRNPSNGDAPGSSKHLHR